MKEKERKKKRKKREKEKEKNIYIINKKGKNEKERCQWKVLKAKGAKWEIGLGKNLNFWNACSLIILYFEFPRKTMILC